MSLNIFVFDVLGKPFATEEERNPLTYLAWFRQWDENTIFEGQYSCIDLSLDTPGATGIFIRVLDEKCTSDDVLVAHRNISEQTIFRTKPILEQINVELFTTYLKIGEWGANPKIESNGSSDDGLVTLMVRGIAPYLDQYIADLRRGMFELVKDDKHPE